MNKISIKIHDFGPFGSEPNWIVDKSLLSDLESIYLSFSSRFVSAPILRTENSFFPIIRENQNDGGELSFAIFCGDNAEGLATSCYTQFVVQSKIGNFTFFLNNSRFLGFNCELCFQ